MEVKDLLDTLGIEAESIEDFKSNFQTKFIPKAQAWEDDEVRSKATGAITHGINQFAKKKLGLSPDEIKGKKYEDVLEHGFLKFQQEIEELKAQGSASNDTVITELKDKLEKASKTINDYKGQVETTKQQAESLAIEWAGKVKSLKVNTVLNEAKGKVSGKLKEMNEAERYYFEHKLKDTFSVDFDENDNVIVLDKAGKRLANPNKIGEFLSVEDAIEQVAISEKYVKMNNSGQANVTQLLNVNSQTQAPAQMQNAPVNSGRKINQKALNQVNLLKG